MNAHKITLSLAMPLGHWSPHLKVALASVAKANAQSKHGQIALSILDASQDGRVCEDIKTSAITPAYMRTGPDDGQTAAISEGWKNVPGDIVGWLNGDDALIFGALDVVFKHFQDNPDTDVVYAQSVISDEHGRIIGLHPEVAPTSSLLLRSNVISQPSCFVRREALDSVGGLNDRLEYTMDWDFWVRLYRSGKNFHYIDQVLSNVVWDFNTKTSKFNWQRIKELNSVIQRNNNLYFRTKSLFGFFQHYWATYKKPIRQNLPISSLKTPVNQYLALPILNLTAMPQDCLSLNLLKTSSKSLIHLLIDGHAEQLSNSHNYIKLSPPIAPGDYVLLEFDNPTKGEVYFKDVLWGQ